MLNIEYKIYVAWFFFSAFTRQLNFLSYKLNEIELIKFSPELDQTQTQTNVNFKQQICYKEQILRVLKSKRYILSSIWLY